MRLLPLACWLSAAQLLTLNCASSALGGSPASVDASQAAIERGLAFLEQDAAKWRQERGCATCHHGTMTVWAQAEARAQGFDVSAQTVADSLQWTKDQFSWRIGKPRDPRPGWNLLSLPAVYLGVMSRSLPILSRDEVLEVADHLQRHQEADGAWLMPELSGNGPPPTWESRETIALLALLAWEPSAGDNSAGGESNRAARDRALSWLGDNGTAQQPQALALRLMVENRSGRTIVELQPMLDTLLALQRPDGGWGPTADAPSDAYTTGQTLWALSELEAAADLPAIEQGVAYLVTNQAPDGSWPMTPRVHPGADTSRQRFPVPIVYFGSAWATIGLVRSVAPAFDHSELQQQALAMIRLLSGTAETDESQTEKPVVRVQIVFEIDDADLTRLVRRLQAFPQLATLQLKSPKITDSGTVELVKLPQLRHLTLENASLTDAGLARLAMLPQLESLNLKGTQVTNSGVDALRAILPQLTVER